MINKIIKALSANPNVTDWLIDETETESTQAFYVLEKLETTRQVKTREYSITVYRRFVENETEYLGSSSFAISRSLTLSELAKKIEEAVFAASFIKNKNYQLVEGGKKRSWKEKAFEMDPFVILDRIASLFFAESSANIRFNSLETFFTKTTTHIVNSKCVDLKKTLYKINVEAIPSYDGSDGKVELYKYFTYTKLDFDTIQNDAKNALKDVTARYLAQKIENIGKIDVILKEADVSEFFENLIQDYSFVGVYKQNTEKKIGDPIQKDVTGDYLTIGQKSASPADAFDADGILLKPMTIISEGKLVSYYGGNQYAQYLNMVPTGNQSVIFVPKGKKTKEKMSKKPHLEIIALSGIQIDMYRGYIGGEVRLANYFDGKENHPVSGFSFSGNIDKCLSHLILSKETTVQPNYQGPKYIRLPEMEIL